MELGATPLFLALPVLLAFSAYFSGSETALFGLDQTQRRRLRGSHPAAAAAVDRLLARPRELLVTLMIGNMAANVTYFVVTSVLTLRASGAAAAAAVSFGCLAAMILFGEVTPKLAATGGRERWCAAAALLLEGIHTLIAPVRAPVSALIGPLARLAPAHAGGAVTHDELAELLSRSSSAGVIDPDEARLLEAVSELSALRVRDVMTPRVRVRWAPAGATRAELVAELRQRPVARVLVCERDLDTGVIGVVDTARFMAYAGPESTLRSRARAAVFVPESATLDRVLDTLREKRESLAVVVDEYGGVAGVVTAGDIVSRLIGESSRSPIDEDRPRVEPLGGGVFRVPGRLSVREWRRALGLPVAGRASTIGGLVMELLGRPPHEGDMARLGPLVIRVERMEGRAVASALVSVDEEGAPS